MTEAYDARLIRNLAMIAGLLGLLLGATVSLTYAMIVTEAKQQQAVMSVGVQPGVPQYAEGSRAPGGAQVQRLSFQHQQQQQQQQVPPVVIVTQPDATPPFRTYRSGRDGSTDFGIVGSVTSADLSIRAALYGRPSPTHRNRWQYFARTATGSDVSMGVSSGGRECLENMGCDELYGGEVVEVPELSNDPMTVRIHRVAPMM